MGDGHCFLPAAANSGQYVATGASRSRSPRSANSSTAQGRRFLGRRPHVDDRVPLPREGAGGVAVTAPEVDDEIAVDVDRQRRTAFFAAGDVVS